MAAVSQNYLRDRASKLMVLVVITVITQIVYAAFVRPKAEEWLTDQRAIAARTPGYSPQRSVLVIIQIRNSRQRSSFRSGRSSLP